MLSLGIKRECVSEKPRKKAMALRRAPLSLGAGEDIPSSTATGVGEEQPSPPSS